MMDSNASPITDISQDVKILKGSQNGTHTSVTFSRNWQTCDPDDYQLTVSYFIIQQLIDNYLFQETIKSKFIYI